MKLILANLYIFFGVILIAFSILVLVQAFDVFTQLNSSFENVGYSIGSIVFPLLLTVIGRWLFRKGINQRKLLKKEKTK